LQSHTYKFNVKMTCGGCSGAVTRALQKTEGQSLQLASRMAGADMVYFSGVESFDVSLEKQEVVVNTALPYDTVLERIKKTGKEV
ncbi:copper ion chaperone, partial [Auricularia subglabra TFB-10046 SS5]